MTLSSMPVCNQKLAEVNRDCDTDKLMICIKLLFQSAI